MIGVMVWVAYPDMKYKLRFAEKNTGYALSSFGIPCIFLLKTRQFVQGCDIIAVIDCIKAFFCVGINKPFGVPCHKGAPRRFFKLFNGGDLPAFVKPQRLFILCYLVYTRVKPFSRRSMNRSSSTINKVLYKIS